MLSILLALAVAAAAAGPPAPIPACAGLTVEGLTTAAANKLVTLRAAGGPDGASYDWDVTPADQADSYEAGGTLVMTGPPGKYAVTLRAYGDSAGKRVIVKCRVTVVIGDAVAPVPMPKIDPKAGDKPAADPVAATARLIIGQAGCTATPVWPRRGDGRWDVLTATHCISRVGQKCKLKLRDGRTLGVTVSALDEAADVCWLVTDDRVENMPYALLSTAAAGVGLKVWHNGFGIDRPSNVEHGVVMSGEFRAGKIPLMISFSPGDSGGGVFREDDGSIIGVASSTMAFARVARAFAGSGLKAAALRPK